MYSIFKKVLLLVLFKFIKGHFRFFFLISNYIKNTYFFYISSVNFVDVSLITYIYGFFLKSLNSEESFKIGVLS